MKDKNSKDLKSFIAGTAVGSVLIGGGVYASTISAKEVTFSNSTTNVQSSLDSLYKTSKKLSDSNTELKYFKYYNECHVNDVQGSDFPKYHQTLRTVFSCDEYALVYNNLKGLHATSLAGSNCSNAAKRCCSNANHCNATSGTCYTKCYSGYDGYYRNCV